MVSDSTLRFPTTLLSEISGIIDDDFCVVEDNKLFWVVVDGEEEALISKDGIVVEVVVL